MSASSSEVADDMPPGVAPSFGDLPDAPFEHTPERIVLSSEEHSHLVGSGPLAYLSGPFSSDRFGVGYLSLHETETTGEVRVHADLSRTGSPAIHLDAQVRETWVARAANDGEDTSATVRAVKELFRLAEIPRQSTVTVQVDTAR